MTSPVFKHFFGSTLGVITSVLSTIVVFIVVSRALGPALFGQFAYTYAIISFMGLLFDYGYPVSLLRETRRIESKGHAELALQSLGLKVLLFALLSFVVLVTAAMLQTNFLLPVGLWIGIAMSSFGNFFSTMLRALGLHGRDAWHSLVANVAGITVALLIYIVSPQLPTFALVFFITGSVYFSLSLNLWRKHCRLGQGSFRWAEIRSEAKKNFVYVLDALGRRSSGYLDVAILGLLMPFETVGMYQVAQKITQGVSIFAQPFNNVLLPQLAQSTDDAYRFRRRSQRAFLAQLAFGLASGGFLIVFGSSLISLLFSDAYIAAAGLLPFFAALIVARYITSALTISKTAQGFIKERLYSNLLGVLVLLTGGPVLTYVAGATGLLLTLIASSVVGAVLLVLLTKGRTVAV